MITELNFIDCNHTPSMLSSKFLYSPAVISYMLDVLHLVRAKHPLTAYLAHHHSPLLNCEEPTIEIGISCEFIRDELLFPGLITLV